MYRTITGACESGTRDFVELNGSKKKTAYSIGELIELTQGSFGGDIFKEFFNR